MPEKSTLDNIYKKIKGLCDRNLRMSFGHTYLVKGKNMVCIKSCYKQFSEALDKEDVEQEILDYIDWIWANEKNRYLFKYSFAFINFPNFIQTFLNKRLQEEEEGKKNKEQLEVHIQARKWGKSE